MMAPALPIIIDGDDECAADDALLHVVPVFVVDDDVLLDAAVVAVVDFVPAFVAVVDLAAVVVVVLPPVDGAAQSNIHQ